MATARAAGARGGRTRRARPGKASRADRAQSVALVIAGAGARGAYEIGALSVLVPWLVERGQTPRIVVGTSAGAINAVLIGSMIDLEDPQDAAQQALEVWRKAARTGVFRPLLLSAPGVGLRYLLRLAGIGDKPVTSLLDPTPLRRTLAQYEHWPQLHENLATGRLDAVALIATATGRHRSEVFVEHGPRGRVPIEDSNRRIAYTPTHLTAEHIMASAAIPVAFPPVRLADAEGAAGDWYLDGGVRLNAPVKPALDLGADRLVVVATHPLSQADDAPPLDTRRLDLFGAFATVITSTLVDRMVEDVRALDRVNRLLGAGAVGTPFRQIPYLFVGPDHSDTISVLAESALHGLRGLDAWRSPDLALLDRLVGGTHSTHGELLSYLLFEPDFVDDLIEHGQRDATNTLQTLGDDAWRLTRE
jgi:NTE family protein